MKNICSNMFNDILLHVLHIVDKQSVVGILDICNNRPQYAAYLDFDDMDNCKLLPSYSKVVDL
jgi:hypothetical protein